MQKRLNNRIYPFGAQFEKKWIQIFQLLFDACTSIIEHAHLCGFLE